MPALEVLLGNVAFISCLVCNQKLVHTHGLTLGNKIVPGIGAAVASVMFDDLFDGG